MSDVDGIRMSDPDGIPAEDQHFPEDEGLPGTQDTDPMTAELGEEGQGDLAPEDEPDAFAGDADAAPRDLREETP